MTNPTPAGEGAGCPKCGAANSGIATTNAWECGSWYQHGFFRSEQCRDNEIASQSATIERLEGEASRLKEALTTILNFSSQPHIEKICREALK
jgi:hypothetical protein